MNFLKLPEGARFSNRQIIAFLIPVIFEQLMVSSLGLVDTLMVSSLGDVSVAGVALVNRIDTFVKAFSLALAQGGSVILSQYIGAQNEEKAQKSLRENIRIVTAIGAFIMLIMLLFKGQIINLLFGGADADVRGVSSTYFSVTALSYPFMALYYACSSAFRAMGKSKIPSSAALIMMAINLSLKYLFIFVFDLGVFGAALSTLLAMATVGIILLIMLNTSKDTVKLTGLFEFDFNKGIASKILRISIPNATEQAMFQLGALAIAGLISGLGTTAIVADQLSRNVCPFLTCIGTAYNAVMLMVIGQCMGADNSDEAKMYVKHILKMDYLTTACVVTVFLLSLRHLLSVFDVSAAAKSLAFYIMCIYAAGSYIVYPLSFAVPSALRGAGDTKFVMIVSSLSMLLFRIGAAYIFAYAFDLGVIGTWMAMVSDWVIRSTIFVTRFKHGKWMENKVI